MNKQISIQKDKIVEFCKKHHILRLAIFGSALRNDFEPESDVDILVDFEDLNINHLFDIRFFLFYKIQELKMVRGIAAPAGFILLEQKREKGFCV